jgi:thiamine-monophosphate kinase
LYRSENEFVEWLQGITGSTHKDEGARSRRHRGGVKLGIGDDAALVSVKSGHELILTTDMSIEGVHFLKGVHPAQAVGHRALARSLSDVAAMGGVPRYVLVSLAISREAGRKWISGFYRGMEALARRFEVRLVGGDTAAVPSRTVIDVLVAGEVPRGKALRRSGARAGDLIFVSGRLGLSALGLRLLRSKHAGPVKVVEAGQALPGVAVLLAREAIQAHLYPEPQCALGRFLSRRGLASAMIDVSDGLSTDLCRLCTASGVGARVWATKIPGPTLPEAADSLHLALDGGEDYRLLFTVPGREAAHLPSNFEGHTLYHLGEIEDSSGVKLIAANGKVRKLEPGGWDHFRSLKASG